MTIQELLDLSIERGASDLHLIVNYYPAIRVDGTLYYLTTLPLLTPEISQQLMLSFLTPEQKENLFANKEIDIGYEYKSYRFRINVYFARGALCAALRLIPAQIKTIEELELPPAFHNITGYNSGLVLVTGPTGEGKSTTLAAFINEINLNTARHIVTAEDPVEFVYPAGKSIVSQRELHQDTHSWTMALRSVLRENPDVVLVGEIRDHETAQLVLTIAETGHLVFSTLHTMSAPETISRIIDIFPSEQQNQIRTQLAGVLRAVISQRLMPREGAKGRIAGIELLYNSPAVSSIIRDGKPYLLENVLQTSESEGFIYFEKYLSHLYTEGKISKETAQFYAIRPKELDKYLK